MTTTSTKTNIKELIREYCPNGVEYKTLGEVCEIRTGRLNANEKDENGLYPFFTCDANPFRINKYAFDTSAILISGNGSQVGHINMYEGKFNAYQRTYVLDNFNKIIKHFLYHYLCHYLKPFIMENAKKGSIPYITLPMLENFSIPVPPLPVQEEIVKILDTFTELTKELTKELTMRKKQYAYYRDKLITENKQAKMVSLGEVAIIKNGRDYKTLEKGNIPVYGTGGIIAYVNQFAYNKPTVLIPRKGSLNKLYYLDTPFWNVDTIFYSEIDEKTINPKFLYYFLQSEHLEDLNEAAGVPSLTQKVLVNIQIPLPPLEEQERIVKILDKFDSLCNDLTSGIPAEIEARRKQYEYYRDKLLTF